MESTLNKVTYAPDPYDKYRLPLEAACVFVEGVKQTTDVGKDLKHVIGRQEARKFYAAKFDEGKGLMPPEAFDSVEWDALKMTLACKPKMYNVWYSKQCSGWCGVNSKLVDWGYSTDSRCPNCNCLGEDAGHLMICKHEGRSAMFEEHVKKIEEWMEDHYTDPQLAELVVFYLRGRGRRKLTHLSRGYRGEYQAMARAQDRIGWRHFTEGKLAKNFWTIQRNYLLQEDTQLTVDSWLKGLVTKLLEMTHAQWIFRCISKHHRTKGSLVLKANEDLLKEIDRQLDMGVDCIAGKDKWMLEVDSVQLANFSLEEKQYWLYEVEAARQAGTRAMEMTDGDTSDWAVIMADNKLSRQLPRTTPIPAEEEVVAAPGSSQSTTASTS